MAWAEGEEAMAAMAPEGGLFASPGGRTGPSGQARGPARTPSRRRWAASGTHPSPTHPVATSTA